MSKHLKKNFGFTILALFIGFVLFSGCSSDKSTSPNNSGNNGGGTPAPSNLVVINNFAFTPSSITISIGDTVTWRNDQGVGHTVTSDTGNALNSSVLSRGQTYRKVFNQTGTYPYHCTPHPEMTGTVVVQSN